MSSYFNEAGEPLMTAAQARLEADIDAQNAEEDAAGMNDVGEHQLRPIGECCICDEPYEVGIVCDSCGRGVCSGHWIETYSGRRLCSECDS